VRERERRGDRDRDCEGERVLFVPFLRGCGVMDRRGERDLDRALSEGGKGDLVIDRPRDGERAYEGERPDIVVAVLTTIKHASKCVRVNSLSSQMFNFGHK